MGDSATRRSIDAAIERLEVDALDRGYAAATIRGRRVVARAPLGPARRRVAGIARTAQLEVDGAGIGRAALIAALINVVQ